MSFASSPKVEAYIETFEDPAYTRLQTLRQEIQTIFPNTIEDISYGMPTYRPAPKKRGIVHFSNFAHHIGLYAVFDPTDQPKLLKALAPYRTGKGTLQFRHDQPFPIDLIREVLTYHAQQFTK
jgi:uncharacterized protein YdhG (YjbR/CyaY superfamily)